MKTPLNIYVRLAIVLGSIGAYAALFRFLAPSAGPASSALIVIPMAIVGWLFGVRASVLFGIVTVPLDFFLFRSVGIANSGGITPHLFAGFAFTLSGMIIGWIRNLMTRVNTQSKELQEKHQLLQEEIGRRVKAEELLSHEALHDSLTNLPNRRLFVNRLEHAIQWSKRHPDDRFAVIYLDFDHFKGINDSLGHNIGDQLLVSMARRLQLSVRAIDTVARLGGDEFALLLEGFRIDDDVITIVKRLLESAAAPLDLDGNTVVMTASVGVVMNIVQYERLDDILRDADIAMYNAKVSGKNRFKVFNIQMQEEAADTLNLDMGLRNGLRNGDFRVHYQPIFSLKPQMITGFEALLRWEHPDRGLLYPADFMKAAEETGLIVPIGQWVLCQACLQMKQWQMLFTMQPPLTISVNLSSRQFAQPDLSQQIEKVLQETGLPAKSLLLELTERTLTEDIETAIGKIEHLQALGIGVEIDDFGTAYSSLGYLGRLSACNLKISRSVVSTLGVNQSGVPILRAIMAVANSLDMKVIAQGIETEDQINNLVDLKCDYGQGFLFTTPVDGDAAQKLLYGAFSTQRH